MKKRISLLSGLILALAAALAIANRYEQLSVGELTVDTGSEGLVTENVDNPNAPWYRAPSYFAPGSFSEWGDDFFSAGYIANSASDGNRFSETANDGAWLVTVVDGGADNGETIAVADNGGSGWLVINNNNAAYDDVQAQMNGEAFAISTSRDLWFEARFEIEDADTNALFVGLGVADTTILGSLGNDFIGFYSDTNSAALDFRMAKNGTIITNTAIATLSDATSTVGASAVTVGFYADGSESNVVVFVNGAVVARNNGSASLPNDLALAPGVAIRTSDTGADYIRVDYIRISQTR